MIYFALVNGYKQPFRDPMTRKYKPGDLCQIFGHVSSRN